MGCNDYFCAKCGFNVNLGHQHIDTPAQKEKQLRGRIEQLQASVDWARAIMRFLANRDSDAGRLLEMADKWLELNPE